TGGDWLHCRPPAGLPFQVVNNYGPTENTVVTTSSGVAPQEQDATPPPLGRPIANTRVYILDRHRHPVPLSVPGELCIAGLGLARGYLRRPGLSAERFLPDPFATAPGARLYRTGDLARYRPDGTLDYLGRLDDQIEIRGLRIEPGEIEAALKRCPRVRDGAVAVRPTPDGGDVLV